MGEPPRRPSQLAVASIVAAIAQVLLPVLAALVAIVTGHVARRRIRRDPTLRGGGLALAGLILGYAGIAFIAAIIALFVRSGLQASHASIRRIDRAVADAQLTTVPTVIIDERENTGVNVDATPTRRIVFDRTGEAMALYDDLVAHLQRAGFTLRTRFNPYTGSSWDRSDDGHGVIVHVAPFEPTPASVEVGDKRVRIPKGHGVVLLELTS